MENGLKNNKGITLIALVITIIVLLILAGVTIATLTGDNGLLTRVDQANVVNRGGTVDDEVKLWQTEWALYNKSGKIGIAPKNEPTMLQDLKDRNLVKDEEIREAEQIIKIGDKEINYGTEETPPTPNLPETVDTKPYLPDHNSKIKENDLNKGIVAIDKNENEWVWVVVPKTLVFRTAKSETDYINIKKDLITYASVYRRSVWDDVYYAGNGFADETEYTNQYNRMLTSVYKYGGFWIGRYEAGTETLRTSVSSGSTTAVSKRDVYPYNYVTVEQAQTKSKEINPDSSNKVSSLMFGIQWDLTLKYIEEKGKLEDGRKVTQEMLKTDSKDWGNYNNITFNVTQGKYSTDYGINFSLVNGIYIKQMNTDILLTTGVSERNKVLNIYDLAGNEWEWTIEKSSLVSSPCSGRGGYYSNPSSYFPAVNRDVAIVSYISNDIAFRPVLIM